MRLRFVATWTVLSVIARASLDLFTLAPPSLLYAMLSLFTVVSIIATPIAQGIALRSAGFRWGSEWAFATITGAVFATAIMHVVRAPQIDHRSCVWR